MLKRRTLESTEPKANMSVWFATSAQRMLLGILLTEQTMLPVFQSKTRNWFLPAPPAKSKSCLRLNRVVYRKGAIALAGSGPGLVVAVVSDLPVF